MAIAIEKEGKTVSEAIISACEELGISRNEVEIEVIREASRGVFGVGERLARVKVTVASDVVSEKGLKAKKALESILNYLISTYSVVLREDSDVIKLDINMSSEKGLLIGRRGETLRALEHLVSRMAANNCKMNRNKKVYIDVGGYISKKEESINKVVLDAVHEVRKTKKKLYLNQMSATERRLAYIVLRRQSDIIFETVADGNSKKILLKSADNRN